MFLQTFSKMQHRKHVRTPWYETDSKRHRESDIYQPLDEEWHGYPSLKTNMLSLTRNALER